MIGSRLGDGSQADAAGYRIVRALPDLVGMRSYAAVASADASPLLLRRAGEDVDGPGGLDEIERAIRAIGRFDHTNLPRLVDVGHDAQRRLVLVTEPLPLDSIAMVVRSGSLSVGGFITLATSLVRAVEHCHAQGVVHGGIALDAVVFDADGRPVLDGFGRSDVPADRGALRVRSAADRDDLLTALTRAAAIVDPPHRGRCAEALSGLRAAGADLGAVVETIVALGEAEPVRAGTDPMRSISDAEADAAPSGGGPVLPPVAVEPAPWPGPGLVADEAPSEVVETRRAAIRRRRGGGRRRAARPSWFRRRRSAIAGRVRPRLLVVGGAVCAVVVILAVTVLGDRNPSEPAAPMQEPSGAIESEASPAADGIGAEDPLAVIESLRLRDGVGSADRLGGVLCPDGADPAVVDPVIGRLDAAPAWTSSVVDDAGDLVIVEIDGGPETTTVSALVMRAETGWCLRSVYAGARAG